MPLPMRHRENGSGSGSAVGQFSVLPFVCKPRTNDAYTRRNPTDYGAYCIGGSASKKSNSPARCFGCYVWDGYRTKDPRYADWCEAAMYESERSKLRKLRWSGNLLSVPQRTCRRGVGAVQPWSQAKPYTFFGSYRQQSALRTRQLTVGDTYRTSQKQARIPPHRSGGTDSAITTAASGLDLRDAS